MSDRRCKPRKLCGSGLRERRLWATFCFCFFLVVAGAAHVKAGAADDMAAHCADFLALAGKKPPQLEFLGCSQSRERQVRVLSASYRVRGGDAALVEDSLRRDTGLPPLVFVCCRWELQKGGRGSFTLPGTQNSCRVTMGSGDTEYFRREEWLLIPWFYVSVTLDLEQP